MRIILRPEEREALRRRQLASPTSPSPLARLQQTSHRLRSVSMDWREICDDFFSTASPIDSVRLAISRMRRDGQSANCEEEVTHG